MTRPLWLVFFLVLICHSNEAATINETFSTDPAAHGWQCFGATNLFGWNSNSQNLSVTWDSSRSNGFFYIPLQTILTRTEDFSFSLDLYLNDVAAGVDPSKPSTFQLAFGFFNLDDAKKPGFFRASGYSPNLVEFDYFPDTGFGATVWPSIWSSNGTLNYGGSSDYTLVDLPVQRQMHIAMMYTASNATLTTVILTNGSPSAPIHPVKLGNSFSDFRVGAFAIESYSDAGQDPAFGGSLLAHGIVDNITAMVPDPPVRNLGLGITNGQWRATFLSASNWSYSLERTIDLQAWNPASSSVTGTGNILDLLDTNAPSTTGFYRVRAQRK